MPNLPDHRELKTDTHTDPKLQLLSHAVLMSDLHFNNLGVGKKNHDYNFN